MTWCWTRASIYRRSVSQSMLMAVSSCQGGVMINNRYNCMVMFACAFYNVFSAKNSHSVTNKSRFVSLEGKRNFTIDFASITFLMKLTHLCSYRLIILVVLHRNAEMIIDSWSTLRWKRPPEVISSNPHDQLERREEQFSCLQSTSWQCHSETQAASFLQNYIFNRHFILQYALPVTAWFHIESNGTDLNPSGKLTTLPEKRNFSWKLLLIDLKMQETQLNVSSVHVH